MKSILWFGKIKTREESLKVIKAVSYVFYAIAALFVISGLFDPAPALGVVDGVVFAICAFLLHKWNSRAVAVILFLILIGDTVLTVFNIFGGVSGGGGQDLLLAIIALWISVRAIQATFGLRRFRQI